MQQPLGVLLGQLLAVRLDLDAEMLGKRVDVAMRAAGLAFVTLFGEAERGVAVVVARAVMVDPLGGQTSVSQGDHHPAEGAASATVGGGPVSRITAPTRALETLRYRTGKGKLSGLPISPRRRGNRVANITTPRQKPGLSRRVSAASAVLVCY